MHEEYFSSWIKNIYIHPPVAYKYLYITTFMICFLIAGCGKKKDTSSAKAAADPVVDVMIAANEKINNVIEVNGTIIANEYVELHPEVSGRLTYLKVPEGEFIKRGTIIARVNDTDLRAQLEKTKSQMELAQQNEGRLKQLLEIEGVNQAEYDAVLNQVHAYRADLNYTQALIEKTIIRAPFDGVIGLRQVSPGAFVSPTTIITTMQQVSKLKVDFTVPEEYGSMVEKGSYVNVLSDESKGTKQKALIVAREPLIDLNTRNIKVRALLQGQGSGTPGSFAKVYLENGNSQNSVMVPSNSIIPEAMNKKIVTVKGGKALFVDIETGVRNAGMVEVTKGLQPGDTVVISGVLFARPNAPVKVRSIKSMAEIIKG